MFALTTTVPPVLPPTSLAYQALAWVEARTPVDSESGRVSTIELTSCLWKTLSSLIETL
jgi:hypothetical protein